MSFKFDRFFTLLINFIVGLFFLLVGLLGILLPWFPSWQDTLIDKILNQPLILSLFGFSFLLIGASIFIYAFLSTHYQYILLRTGKNAVQIDKTVIENYLKSYWEKQFPQTTIPFTVILKKHSIQVQAHFPFLPLEQQKTFLEKIGQDFPYLFEELIGYSQEVNLIASFQNATVSPLDHTT